MLSKEAIRTRRLAVDESPDLYAVARQLNAHLDVLRADPVYIPERKAVLTRHGGVCAEDGSRLRFDPLRPDAHRCPRCRAVYRGDDHHRAWVWRYHLWLSERVLHFAVLGALAVAPDGLERSARLLADYAGRYRSYPNRDNVLGPTRLFFSTYLEAIWLAQLATAARVLAACGPEMWQPVRPAVEAMLAESAGLVGSYDEGASNRQVWNDVGVLAAALALGDRDLERQAVVAPSGIERLLERAVTAGGRWHEGENYQFFALRGFQYGAELLRSATYERQEWLDERLTAMAVAPLDTLLPDLTFPARGDSPFGVSVRQYRYADLWELAWRRSGDERVEGMLAELYRFDGPVARRGLEEISEQEVHRPAGRLERGQLGWRALLWMRPDPPRERPWTTGSVAVPSGPAVLRPGGAYVAVETGTGPGHGHPDVLHLTIASDTIRTVDPGTASYVSESLFWYRSALAHNAPSTQGEQALTRAAVTALEDADTAAWVRLVAPDLLGPGTRAVRTVIVQYGWVLDVVDVDVPEDVEVDLPVHLPPDPALDGDGGQFCTRHSAFCTRLATIGIHDIQRVDVPAPVHFAGGARGWLLPREHEIMLGARAPGPPTLDFADGPDTSFLIRRASGPGRWVTVLDDRGELTDARPGSGGSVELLTRAGPLAVSWDDDEARIVSAAGTTVLRGAQRVSPAPPSVRQPARPIVVCPAGPGESRARFTLGKNHYRRSEEPYPGTDALCAQLHLGVRGTQILIDVHVLKPEVVLVDDRRAPVLDNDPPEIHADGVQVYWTGPLSDPPPAFEGVLLIPRRDGDVDVRPAGGLGTDPRRVHARWQRRSDGYEVAAELDTGVPLAPGARFLLQVVVNEMRPGRTRRAGQLAFGGGGGWVYLRGDRESPANAVVVEVQ